MPDVRAMSATGAGCLQNVATRVASAAATSPASAASAAAIAAVETRRTVAVGVTAASLVLIWALVFAMRHRVLRRRETRLAADALCVFLAGAAWALFAIAAARTTRAAAALHGACVALVVAATWMLVVSVVDGAFELFSKAEPARRVRVDGRRNETRRDARLSAVTPPRVRAAPYGLFLGVFEPESYDALRVSACCICLDGMEADAVRLCKCAHTFHRKCIQRWLMHADEPSCPLCKAALGMCWR